MIRYDPHHWRDHFFDIRGTLLREIFARVLTCVIWSAGVVAWHMYVFPVAIQVTIHSLVGVALGLLLVFRTNASYDRFWEGRKLWGAIVNDCRNLARYGLSHLGANRELAVELVRWTAIFPYATMSSLRDAYDVGPPAEELPPAQKETLLSSQHLALHTAQRITAIIKRAFDENLITDRVNIALDEIVQRLIDSLGACERIRKTPLPFAYVVHLRRALVIYCFTLPFALVRDFGWFTVLDVALVAYTFFGIEEIGVEIEGPFGHDENDLPLEDICGNIHRNLYTMAGLVELPRVKDPQAL